MTRFILIFSQDGAIQPSTLGEALVAGYNAIGLRLLSQPHLRAKTEADMKGISENRKTKVM